MTRTYELVVGTRDLDGGHVDNSIVPAYVGDARDRFIRDTVDRSPGYGVPVVRLELDYCAELHAGDRVSATVGIVEVGTTSFTTETELTAGGELAAEARTVQVVTHPETGDVIEIPDDWRAALERS